MQVNTVYSWRPKRPPLKHTVLGNFMLTNMLGHLWLNDRECPWPLTDFKIKLAGTSGSVTMSAIDLNNITVSNGEEKSEPN